MSQSNEREEHIFARALAIPVSERPRFLEVECGADLELQARVESLLRAHESAGDFMESHPAPETGRRPAARSQGTAEAAGDRIGRYKLQQKIGEGGCGVVWMAEQEEPVRRQVALKIIKLGMDTKEVIARFEAERQALAMLDHPNIAKILDAGATETGRPYFVMELVRGIKITDFCDRYNLSTAHRLELFSEVCNAVQHAHQKGIIHRDLKPSNVLVTLNDAKPVPKVIDFGIAKATSGRLTDHTLFTAFEQFLGTPAYMSPEQAELSGIDIDTRSDIYSLGVLLYELLTGRLPFDPKTLLQAGIDEIRRIIREVDPPKPSTNLSTLGDSDRAHVARVRNTDAEKLSVLLRGDLDWIVMRCLEKDRSRRYETPNALSADIERHLKNEPVVARPPSRGYRLERLIRRNRLAFAAVVSVGLALISGFGVSTWQAVRAIRAERLADMERARAVDERSRAEDLLKFMLGDLYKQLNKVGRLDVLDAVADKANSYFTTLGPVELDDTTKLARARALRLVGAVRLAEGRLDEALAAYSEAYGRSVAIATQRPKDSEVLYERGKAEFGTGNVFWSRSNFLEARIWLTRYRDTCAILAALEPTKADRGLDLCEGQLNLAALSVQLGDQGAAKSAYLQGLSLLKKASVEDPSNLDLRGTMVEVNSSLGDIAQTNGDFAEALRQYTMESEQLEFIASADPKTMDTQLSQAIALLKIVNVETVTGNYSAARVALLRAEKLLAALVARDDKNVIWKSNFINARIYEAILAHLAGDSAEGFRVLEEIRPGLEAIVAKDRTASDYTVWLMNIQLWETRLKLILHETDAAISASKAVELAEELSHGKGITASRIGKCAEALELSGDIDASLGNSIRARDKWIQALDLLAPRIRSTRDWHLLDPAARAEARLGRYAEAAAAVETLTQLGYVPVKPWPDLKGSAAAKDPDQQKNKETNP
jgi:serine/threonine protein kinase